MTSRRLSHIALLVLTISLVTGCSSLFGREGYFRDRGDDYLRAYEIPPMKVADGKNAAAVSEMFVIPGIGNDYVDPDKEFEVPRVDPGRAVEAAAVKIQALHDRQWISVSGSPGKVWPQVIKFFEDSSLKLSRTDAANGQIETAWLTLKSDQSKQDKYRITLEQGLQPAHTEVHITQISSAVIAGGDIGDWPKHSHNPERAKWLSDNLAGYLANLQDAGVSLLAQSIGSRPKVEFIKIYQGEAFLVFTIDFERVWASVGGALITHPFSIEDMNRSEVTIDFTYDPEPTLTSVDEPGFFSRLFGLDKKAEIKRLERLHHYTVHIIPATGSEYRVYIKTRNNETIDPELRDKLLQLLKNQLV